MCIRDSWKFYQGYGLIDDALYNLKDDPMETSNVLTGHPERVENLQRKLNQWLTKVAAKMPTAKARK